MPDDGALYRMGGNTFSYDEIVEPDADADDDDWRRRTKYLYAGRVVTYDELRRDAEVEAAGLPPEQRIDRRVRIRRLAFGLSARRDYRVRR